MPIPVIPQPSGVTPLSDYDRQPVSRVICGDAIALALRLALPGGAPATPDNSLVDFRLSDQRFSATPIWTCGWRNGAELDERTGITTVTIPQAVSARLRRGDFQWALALSDKLGGQRATVAQGSLLVEYAVTSPHRSIPYKD